MLRNLLGFFLSPFPAALIESITVALRPKPGTGVFTHPASMFVFVCLLLYAFEIVLGLPAVIMLRRRGVSSLRVYALAGMAVTAIPVAIPLFLTAARGRTSLYVVTYDLVYFAVSGLLAGTVFWAMTRPGRRDPRLGKVFE